MSTTRSRGGTGTDMSNDTSGTTALLERIRIPQHVVYRRLANETVMLNVQTGQYHGLNETGGRILEVLEETADAELTVSRLAGEFGVAEEALRADVARFCDDLARRGLIEIG